MQFHVTSGGPKPGTYDAMLVSIIEKVSKDGDEFRIWEFEVRTADGLAEISGTSSKRDGPATKSYKWLSAVLGRKPSDEIIDDDDLVGKAATVVVDENEAGYARVVDVLPARLTDATAEAYADQADAEPF